ncbi:MAG: DUF2961 domain-containing protein [Planctomycetes bacterium]|nr:DUF2961 domain-containing protein [Planctomycetota bacterium]
MRMTTILTRLLVVLLSTGAVLVLAAAPPDGRPSGETGRTALLDRLVHLPGQVRVLQASSHNKTGQNGDENWPLYVDEHGDHVIFDAAGPGCIRSMWGTHFAEDALLKFYFDGEAKPRYELREVEFYSGGQPDFRPPLVSYERRGYYDQGLAGNSFVPIPFAKSLKIAVAGESRFFHILYECYPHGTPVQSFTGNEQWLALEDCYTHLGENLLPQDAVEAVEVVQDDNTPGAEVVLFERRDGSGIIRAIEIEADGSPACLQESEIQMRWDGHVHADVRAPLGIFFGCANAAHDVSTLPLVVSRLEGGRIRLRCFFPMPFWQEARVVWRNGSPHRVGSLVSRILVSANDLERERSGHFTTCYRSGETTYGRDWLLFDRVGTGWLAGVVQTMQHGHYCEGDEHFCIDGAVSPQINGTGSEDYYLGCFWPNLPYNSPFASCVGDAQAEGGGHFFGAYRVPACYGRFHLECPIPFHQVIDARIQHGGLSQLRSNYSSLAYAYLRNRPALRTSDFIDVGNSTSETAHGYQARESELTGWVQGSPEGADFTTVLEERGRRHARGEITFSVAVDPDNDGVRLRRRLDQSSMCQGADVYVDGAYAGTWYHGYHNEHLRWFDSDFDIHPQHTRAKQSLQLKLVVKAEGIHGPFTDFKYWVCCFESAGAEESGRPD